MIFDKRTQFCDATALDTSGTNTDLIGDVVDLGAEARDIGNGQTLYLVIQVETTVTSGGSATVDFKLASDAQAAIATDGSATVHLTSGPVPVASLVAGYKLIYTLPMGVDYERYLGILTDTATAALTAGKINAFLTLDPHGTKAYPNAI